MKWKSLSAGNFRLGLFLGGLSFVLVNCTGLDPADFSEITINVSVDCGATTSNVTGLESIQIELASPSGSFNNNNCPGNIDQDAAGYCVSNGFYTNPNDALGWFVEVAVTGTCDENGTISFEKTYSGNDLIDLGPGGPGQPCGFILEDFPIGTGNVFIDVTIIEPCRIVAGNCTNCPGDNQFRTRYSARMEATDLCTTASPSTLEDCEQSNVILFQTGDYTIDQIVCNGC